MMEDYIGLIIHKLYRANHSQIPIFLYRANNSQIPSTF